MRGAAGVIGVMLALGACSTSSHGTSARTTGAESPDTMDAGATSGPEPEAPPPPTQTPPAPTRIEEPDAGPPPPTPAPTRTDLPVVGPTLGAATADDAEVDAAWNSFLTNHARPDCAIDEALSWLHEGCRPLRPTRVSTSATDGSTLVHAFDLDACTVFDGGAAPVVVEIELAQRETIDLIVIDPGPHASGASRHVIETPGPHGRWVPRSVLYGGYYDSVLYALRLAEPVTTQRLRIRTIASPGAVEHREIVPVACDGEVSIHVEGIPPDPPPVTPEIDWHDPRYTHVTEHGHCRHDADCAPVSCCGGYHCGPASEAPDCDGVGCPQSCGSPLACGRGACICFHGMCSLATTYAPGDLSP